MMLKPKVFETFQCVFEEGSNELKGSVKICPNLILFSSRLILSCDRGSARRPKLEETA